MAGRGLGTLTLDLVLRMGGFTGPLDKAGRDLDKRLKGMQKRAEQVGKAIGVALVGAATAAGYAIKSAIDRADELSKTSQKIGITTEALSRLSYAADLSDVSIEQLQQGLGKLTRYQAEAAQGNKEAIQTFAAFGIEIKDVAGNLRGTEAVLQDFARVFKALPDGPEKTALALRVFGKSGAELIPLLNEGADGLARMADEADRLGITISTQTGKQAEEFNDNITTLKAGLTGLATQIADKVLPALIDLTQTIKDFDASGAGSALGEEIAFGLEYARKSIERTKYEIQALQTVWRSGNIGPFGANIVGALAEGQRAAEAAAAQRAALSGTSAALGNPGNSGGRGVASARAAGQADAEAAKAAEAARKLLATTQDSTRASRENADAKRAAAEAAREQAERERELEEAARKASEAQAEFTRQLEDLVAQQGGPLAESALRYRREEEALRKLWAEGSIPSAEDLATALTALHEARDKDADSIRKSLDTGEQQLQQMREELELLQAKSTAERDRIAFLQANPTASGAQADEAVGLGAQLDETRRQIAAADDVRMAFQDMAVNVWTDGIDAVDDFFDAIRQQIAQLIAQNISRSLFGDMGTSGSGFFGSLLGGLFGLGSGSTASSGASGFLSAFGGSYANGTNFAPGGMSLVGERGPEIVNLPRGSQVVPNHKLGGGKFELHFHGAVTEKVAQQAANRVSRQVAFAQRGGR